MARLTRSQLLYDGCYAHVMSRSIAKNKIFKDQDDFELFSKLLLNVKRENKFKIFHYCLMHTHFHLAVKMSRRELFSKAIQKLKSLYTYQYHTKYKAVGPIWRGRFRSMLIESEDYVYACGQYIENNPLKIDLVKQSRDWKYSSSAHYVEGRKNDLIDDYENHALPRAPKDVDVFDDALFEKGLGIGSSFFRFQLKESVK